MENEINRQHERADEGDAITGAPRFRLLAIAGDMDRIDRIRECALRARDLPLGLMLRDPLHRPGHVIALHTYAITLHMPPNVSLILNGVHHVTAEYMHLTAADPVMSRDPADWLRPEGSFGASAHSIEDAIRAESLGARYITLSPIFPTASKPGHPGIGLDALREIASSISTPIFALGGMNDIDAVIAALDAGAHGIASISLFAPESGAALERVVEHLRMRVENSE